MCARPSGTLQFTRYKLNVKVFCNGEKGLERESRSHPGRMMVALDVHIA